MENAPGDLIYFPLVNVLKELMQGLASYVLRLSLIPIAWDCLLQVAIALFENLVFI